MTSDKFKNTAILIDEIIEDIEKDKIQLSKALLKSKKVSRHFQDKELEKFISTELEDKYDEDKLPDYRKVYGLPIGVFQNIYNGRIEQVTLNFDPLIKALNIDIEIHLRYLRFTVPEIEELIKKADNDDLKLEFTPDQLNLSRQYLSQDFSEGWQLKNGFYRFPFSTLTQILTCTQNRFIDILLRIRSDIENRDQICNEQFFEEGKHFDAIYKLSDTINQAIEEVILIDNYVNENTLNLFTSKKPNVQVKIITNTKSNNDRLKLFVENFNKQYNHLLVKESNAFHDRFLIIDNKQFFHIGASIKDAGKKTFMYSLIEEKFIQDSVLEKFNKEWSK
jgi:hypothetical protein